MRPLPGRLSHDDAGCLPVRDVDLAFVIDCNSNWIFEWCCAAADTDGFHCPTRRDLADVPVPIDRHAGWMVEKRGAAVAVRETSDPSSACAGIGRTRNSGDHPVRTNLPNRL